MNSKTLPEKINARLQLENNLLRTENLSLKAQIEEINKYLDGVCAFEAEKARIAKKEEFSNAGMPSGELAKVFRDYTKMYDISEE